MTYHAARVHDPEMARLDREQDRRVATLRTGDAEQAKSTGGMIALIPSEPEKLAVPGGEPVDDLHLTVTYFGEDVTGLESVEILSFLDDLAPQIGSLQAKIFALALFNPTGADPCAVYLVGDNPVLSELYTACKNFALDRFPGAAEQHDPWCPHITAGYGLDLSLLTYQGPVFFDRLSLHWAGEVFDFPL